MVSAFKKPKVKQSGPSDAEVKAQREAEALQKKKDTRANKELSASTKASLGRRTGRRLLLAPGREDEISKLSGGASSGSF